MFVAYEQSRRTATVALAACLRAAGRPAARWCATIAEERSREVCTPHPASVDDHRGVRTPARSDRMGRSSRTARHAAQDRLDSSGPNELAERGDRRSNTTRHARGVHSVQLQSDRNRVRLSQFENERDASQKGTTRRSTVAAYTWDCGRLSSRRHRHATGLSLARTHARRRRRTLPKRRVRSRRLRTTPTLAW